MESPAGKGPREVPSVRDLFRSLSHAIRVYIYIYMYVERDEREREKARERERERGKRRASWNLEKRWAYRL